MRTYSEIIKMGSFLERFNYLKLNGRVGKETFGADRYLNQMFYRSREWRQVRDYVISRDLGCDLGLQGYEIYDKLMIHHMNPITPEHIEHADPIILDPEYLILTSERTHNAIHYGDENLLVSVPIERHKFDTCPWRQTIKKEETL